MKRITALLMAMVLVISLFAACSTNNNAGNSNQDSGTETNKETEPAKNEPDAEPVTLKWMHHYSEEGLRKWVDQTIADFTAIYPNVKFEVSATNFDNYGSLLKTKLASGDAPDIFDADPKANKEFIDAGYLLDITDHPLWSNVQEFAAKAATIDNKRYSIPLEASFFGVTYNKEALEKVGFTEFPDTMTGFQDLLNKLKDAGIAPIAAPYKEWWTLACDLHIDTYRISGSKNPQWRNELEARTKKFVDDDTGYRDVLKRLYDRYAFTQPDPFGTDWNSAQEMVATGKAAMILNGSWTVGGVQSKNPDVKLGVAALPLSDNAADTMLVMGAGSGGIVGYAKSPNKEYVLKFLEFVATKENAQKYQEMKKAISTVKGLEVKFDPAFESVTKYQNENRISGYSGITGDFSEQYNKAYFDTISAHLLKKDFDVEQTLVDLDKAFDQLHDR